MSFNINKELDYVKLIRQKKNNGERITVSQILGEIKDQSLDEETIIKALIHLNFIPPQKDPITEEEYLAKCY